MAVRGTRAKQRGWIRDQPSLTARILPALTAFHRPDYAPPTHAVLAMPGGKSRTGALLYEVRGQRHVGLHPLWHRASRRGGVLLRMRSGGGHDLERRIEVCLP